ncbi:sugar ABC transporter substrate-binding protein [bacterium]|nr:sugar ABC transporter substrate-binding protein [bacterium]
MKSSLKKIALIISAAVLFSGCTHKNTPVKIEFASWGSKSEIEIIKPILENFEKENSDIKVEFMHIPQNYFQKIHLLFASNTAPDVIFLNNLYLPIYANAGLLEELKAPEGVFEEKTLEALSYNGKLYAIPRDVSNLVIFYNKYLFNKHKIPYPDRNWTFEDFLKTAQKLTDKDTFGISFEEDCLFFLPYLMSEGGGILSDDLQTEIINSPESQKGLKFYADLRNKYNVAPKREQSASATMAQLFLQGKLGMHLSGRWLVPKYREECDFDWDIINFPSGEKGSIVPLDASGWAISKSSKHKNEARKLIEYLSSKENIEKMTKSGLIVPARIDAANSKTFLDDKKPKNAKIFLEVLKTSKPTPVSVNYNEIQDKVKAELEPLFNSKN